jgi:hypothetical protein
MRPEGGALELIGISERHFRRLRDRYEADGTDGLSGLVEH